MDILLKRFVWLILILTTTNLSAQDWPDLNRYRKENKELGLPAPGERRIVFMGNSITEGWKQADPELFSRPGFVNRGIGGQTTPQMLLRFRQDVISLNPQVVVILAGTNDIAGNTGPMSLDQIRDNIISMAELALSNDIQVILCSVLPAFDYTWRPGLNPDKKIPELNRMLSSYAQEKNLYYLDYFSAMADDRNGLPEELAADGVHPTKAGYDLMKGMLLKALNALDD